MSKIALQQCVIALIVASGCQGPQATVATGPGPALQSRVVHALPRGGSSVASLRTLPNATCALYDAAPNGSASPRLRVFADDDGLVRVHLTHLDPNVAAGELRLDCADDAGNAVAHTLSIVVDDNAIAQAAAPYDKTGKPTLPVLDVDPATLSDADVQARNYPPRPDATTHAAEYQHWLELVTGAPTLIAPHLVADPTRKHAVATRMSNNWSGYIIATPPAASEYAWIYGEWNVPRMSAESGFASADYSSLWVGLDGEGTSDVVQDGTDQDTMTAFWIQSSSFDAWTEWYPASTMTISNFPVKPGDDIRAWTWVKDASGNWDPAATVGWFYLWNATENVYVVTSTTVPAGTTFTGHAAEWVLERPTVLGLLPSLAQFSPTSITGAMAYDLAGAAHGYGADAAENVTMQNTSNNDILATVTPVNATTMAFTWVNHQ